MHLLHHKVLYGTYPNACEERKKKTTNCETEFLTSTYLPLKRRATE